MIGGRSGLTLIAGLMLMVLAFPSHAADYGPVNEPAATTGDIFVDGTLVNNCTSGNYSIQNRNCSGSDGNAYRTLREGVNAMGEGDIVLIRGDNYSDSSTITLPNRRNAAEGNLIKPYNQEAVTFDGRIIMGNYATIAGLTLINSLPIPGGTVHFPSDSTHITVRNNDITGGGRNAIQIDGGTYGLIQGNYLKTAAADDRSTIHGSPGNGFLIDGNKFENVHPKAGADLIQFIHWRGGTVEVSNNWFRHNEDENAVDWKIPDADGVKGAVGIVRNNRFDGESIHDGCMIIWADIPDRNTNYIVEGNYFHNCNQRAINLKVAPEPPPKTQSPVAIVSNLFISDKSSEAFRVEGNDFLAERNTIIGCSIALGSGQRSPSSATLLDNILYSGNINDRTKEGSFLCRNNRVYNSTGSFKIPCSDTTMADPLFVDIEAGDFNTLDAGIVDGGTVTGRYLGAARDLGAFEAPVIGACAVPSRDANAVVCDWHVLYPPLSAVDYTKFTVYVNGSPRTSIAGEIRSDFQTRVVFSGPAVTDGQSVTLDIGYGAVQDAILIGGPEVGLNARSAAKTGIHVTNEVGGGSGSGN
jgi:hypothetical protein